MQQPPLYDNLLLHDTCHGTVMPVLARRGQCESRHHGCYQSPSPVNMRTASPQSPLSRQTQEHPAGSTSQHSSCSAYVYISIRPLHSSMLAATRSLPICPI